MESCRKKKRKELEKTGLSDLPDELILKIFSLLPFFKENLATRLISEYWEGRPWKPEPNVMFDDRSHESLETSMSLIYGSLMSKDAQILERLHLKLGYNVYSASDINFLVQVGVVRSLRELRIDLFGKNLELPCCLSTCRTLKELVLHDLSIRVVPPWFCLPSLKTLHLLSVQFSGDVASLLRICPVLERLVVDQTRDANVMISNISVPTLRTLSIDNGKRTYNWRAYAWESRGFLINAPSLMFLNIKDAFSKFIMFESMPELIKANIEVTHNQSEKFIGSFTSIRHLSLCSLTSENPYPTGTKFSSLEHLKLCTCSAGWQDLLACMLNDAPNLRSLTLKLRHKVNVNNQKNQKTSMSFVYGSLMSNDAQILESLHLKLSYHYSDSDINFLVQVGVNRSVRELRIDSLTPRTLELPCCLSTCRTLKELVLHNFSIKVVPPWFCLPSLKTLQLLSVNFSGEDESIASLLRICPVLERLVVDQTRDDLVMFYNINVPTLRSLSINNRRTSWRTHARESRGFLINAPSLVFLNIKNAFRNFIWFESMPELIKADIEINHSQTEKFIESLTSIRHLSLCSPTSETPYPTGTIFSSLEHLKLCTCSAGWQNLLARMLNDAPKLRSLTLKLRHKVNVNNPKNLWEKPTVVPECLTHLEILKWRGYVGTKHEKNLVRYILANATCLQKATFSTRCRNQCDSKLMELKSMNRVSEKCQFVFD